MCAVLLTPLLLLPNYLQQPCCLAVVLWHHVQRERHTVPIPYNILQIVWLQRLANRGVACCPALVDSCHGYGTSHACTFMTPKLGIQRCLPLMCGLLQAGICSCCVLTGLPGKADIMTVCT